MTTTKTITLIDLRTGQLSEVKVIRSTKCFVVVQGSDWLEPEKLSRKTGKLVNGGMAVMLIAELEDL